MKPLFCLYQIWWCEVNGFIRQRIAIQGLCNALCLSCPGYVSSFAMYEGIKLQGNRLAQANNMECFYSTMWFRATIYNNHWVCADNLAPCGQAARTDTCLTPERETRWPAAWSFWGTSTRRKALQQRNVSFENISLVERALFPELTVKQGRAPEETPKHNKHLDTRLNTVISVGLF